MEAKIRVNKGINIEVNDAGDHIVARVEDYDFLDGFRVLIGKMERIQAEFEAGERKDLSVEARIDLAREKMQEVAAAIDALFGEGTCDKVFGKGTVPSGYQVADFFGQLSPIIQGYVSDRRKEASEKYGRNRGSTRTRR